MVSPKRNAIAVHTSLLFDPKRKAFVKDVTIKVSPVTGAITSLYTRSSYQPFASQPNDIDLRGKVVLPGFVDAHTHIFLHTNAPLPPNVSLLPIERTLRATNHARAALLAGYTTYRDLGSEAMGAYVIKVYADYRRKVMRWPADLPGSEGRVLFPPDRGERNPVVLLYTREEMEAIVDEARMAGLPVAAHAGEAATALMAVRAGVASVEHMFEDKEGVMGEVEEEMMKRGTIWVPTLAAAEVYFDEGKMGRCKERVKKAFDNGVTIAAGGDTGTFNHGLNSREMEIMVEAGIPVEDVLVAGTYHGWLACGKDACGFRFGWWDEGNRADIIALDTDPREDPKALRNVSFVMKDGRDSEDPFALFGLPFTTALSLPSISKINLAPNAFHDHNARSTAAKQNPPVTWDNASLLINGKREMILSGEFHPFRLPVPALWHDVLEKMKAAGLNTVSFYINWALLEGKRGDFRASGIFSLDEFFEAAKEVGFPAKVQVGVKFPDPGYMQYVEDQARKGGIVVPFISNDGWDAGNNIPGSGVGQVDIYGHELYPLDWDCNDVGWDKGTLRDALYSRHLSLSSATPFALSEGGMLDLWGSSGPARCAEKYNQEHSRVWYKNNYGAGVKIFNIFPAIDEDRRVDREKYSELKLQTNFLKVSAGYLTAIPEVKPTTGVYSPNQNITVTAVVGPEGGFYVTRKTAFRDKTPLNYTLTLPTSKGMIAIPKLGGTLTMPGRDTRIHVTDYPVDIHKVIYCTAEIFTWKKFDDKTIVFIYGGMGETHELLLERNPVSLLLTKVSPGVKTEQAGAYLYAQWTTGATRQMIRAGSLFIYMIDRASAYKLWVPDTPGQPPLIISGGYLIRTAKFTDTTLSIRGDFTNDTTLEIFGVPKTVTTILVNSKPPKTQQFDENGIWQAQIAYAVRLLEKALHTYKFQWKYLDTLPELSPSYSDAAWPDASILTTNNTFLQAQKTETSLFAGDYGFHAGGALLFRGRFTATGQEKVFNVVTQGGVAFASMAWLNEMFLGSWPGNATARVHSDSYALAGLKAGEEYVLTVLVDNMGYAQNNNVGGDDMKAPRGILEYWFGMGAGEQPKVRWKVTGNLKGEDYVDKVRGPLNEGGLFAERQGYHQPSPPATKFVDGDPINKGIGKPGVGFYTTEFKLEVAYDESNDTPMRIEFPAIDPVKSNNYRVSFWVNGYHLRYHSKLFRGETNTYLVADFGRYISHIGPQTSFPVPEGVFKYNGTNTLAMVIWATHTEGARVQPLNLQLDTTFSESSRRQVLPIAAPAWAERPGAY
ncbi:hypothetical protein N0V88_003748 [Collariella sp. IMI 366227]|nr:hypothetical protein N0V88_003748 [Collariella sp. IMI 366227]